MDQLLEIRVTNDYDYARAYNHNVIYTKNASRMIYVEKLSKVDGQISPDITFPAYTEIVAKHKHTHEEFTISSLANRHLKIGDTGTQWELEDYVSPVKYIQRNRKKIDEVIAKALNGICPY